MTPVSRCGQGKRWPPLNYPNRQRLLYAEGIDRLKFSMEGAIHMILDQTWCLALYKGIHPGIDLAIDYLHHTDITALKAGRHDIDGENVYLFVQHPTLREEGHWECHREHIDIQIALSDGEVIGWAPTESIKEWGAYNPAIDRTESPAAGWGTLLHMRKGFCAVFFPQDAHKTRLGDGMTHKAVIKIRK